jgi:hypothetical protein
MEIVPDPSDRDIVGDFSVADSGRPRLAATIDELDS